MGYVHDLWFKDGQDGARVPTKYHGKGKRWQARYEDPTGKVRTRLFAKKVDAEKEVLKQESAKAAGSWIDPDAGKITVERFALDVWLPAQGIIGRTEYEYRGVLNRYLIPEWGSRQIRSIRPSEAGAWQKLLTAKYELTGTTPSKVARRVRSIFRLAVIDRVINVSPFEGIPAPAAVQTVVSPPDVAEVLQLIQAAYTTRWRAMIELTALTGLRSGEVRGLDVRRIDFLRQQLHVERQLVYEAGKGHYFAPLKTGAGKRTVPLPRRAVDLLAAYVKEHPPPIDGEWAGTVFLMPGKTPVGESTLDWALKSTCRKAGTTPRHWHELRHHYASVLIGGGENPRVVQRRLGHKNVTTTLSVYTHLFSEAEERTRSVLEDAWAAVAESTAPADRKAGVIQLAQ